MANEDIIKSWVQKKLEKIGFTVGRNNLAKESAKNAFPELYNAMKHSSKKQNGERGTSDFSYFVQGEDSGDNYLILIETKDDISEAANISGAHLLLDVKSTSNYAANGAVWYGKQIQKESRLFPKIFTIGIAGNYERQVIVPYFVNETGGVISLPATEGLTEFSSEKIDEYYRVNVLHNLPQSELNADQLAKYASELHNDIRTLASLKNSLKAPLVAAILLGIHSKNLTLDMLKGSNSVKNNDGVHIFNAVSEYLEQRKREEPDFDDEKIEPILNEFSFIKSTKELYMPSDSLGGNSPLYKFTADLFDVYTTVKIGEDADLLGDFYSEFVKYNSSDGNVLGIVLTPKHITGLMADLIQVGKKNYLLDPTTGSGSFLVAGMNRMISQIPKDENYNKMFNEIVSTHLYGVENEPSIYAVAAANMILRGDGKSNMTYGSFFDYKLMSEKKESDSEKINYSRAKKIDRILMNPPYSQGKKAPEYKFIKKALELLSNDGRMAVIIPTSVFVSGGKEVSSKELKEFKEWLLKDYVIEDIITMNPLTFYPTATQTVIAIISKNEGIGQGGRKTKLINFTDDGYDLIPKKGLIPNGTDEQKREKLINVVINEEDASEDFMMKVQLTSENEWIHSAHYTNPDHPTDGDFMSAVADYVSFKESMIFHGRGDLFDDDKTK